MNARLYFILSLFCIALGSALLVKSNKVDDREIINASKADITEEDVVMSEDVSPFTKDKTFGYELVKDGDLYDVYLGDSIISASNYKDLIRGLAKLEADDTVVIHLANYGGYVSSGVQIINAMNASKAKIVTLVEGPSYSMGALIACAGDEVIVQDYSWLMFHHYSGTFQGKGAESREIIKALDRLSTDLMRTECVTKGILTDDQVEAINNGIDVYVHSTDLN